MSSPPIQWYPGHIAKAEQQLRRNLDKVDLVIEVRDARIPHLDHQIHLVEIAAQLLFRLGDVARIPLNRRRTHGTTNTGQGAS